MCVCMCVCARVLCVCVCACIGVCVCVQTGAVADQTLMLDLLDVCLPELRTALVGLGGSGHEPAFVAMRWFLCLYTHPFSPKFSARVWDAFLLDGGKILFRTALALFRQVCGIVCSAPR